MMRTIETVAVIGAGVMGSGIAAHAANAGANVVLLDIPAKGENRNAHAEGALARMLKANPAAFTHARNARRVRTGNIEDDLGLIADADWIVEAVIEKIDVKRDLYRRLEPVRKDGSIVSSNTSTIPLARLVEGLPARLRQDFMITHFFNPPRYMRLLEIVAGPDTRADAVDAMREFGDRHLGKGVVACKDTPGFIANRIGTYWIQCALVEALELGLTVEEADAVVGRPMGIPKTGVFGLLDLVGIDLMPHVATSMLEHLPADDDYRRIHSEPALIKRMIAEGYTGRKGKGGFYRLNTEGGQRVKESLDLTDGTYAATVRADLDSVAAARSGGVRALIEHPDKGGQYAWRVLSQVLSYAASLVPEIADTIADVDEAMRLGYAWKWGPFELIDRLGAAALAQRLAAADRPVPPLLVAVGDRSLYRETDGRLQQFGVDGGYHDVTRAEGAWRLADIKRAGRPIAKNPAASLWDIGDGIVCLEFHTKLNALDNNSLAMVREAIAVVKRRYKGLVIGNDAEHFSAGANIGLLLFVANTAQWSMIEGMIQEGQETMLALKYAPFPVVAAPAGMALGGGCEIIMHSDAVQAHIELYSGLVEVGIGVVPAWGGCKEYLLRADASADAPHGPVAPVARAFEAISLAKVSRSAEEARDLGILGPDDGITMNRDRVLADAKARALALAKDYRPREPRTLALPGPTAKVAMQMAVEGFVKTGKASAHDAVVADALADVLSGGDTDMTETLSETDVLALERKAFARLVREAPTLARVEHMLETGKPLRN